MIADVLSGALRWHVEQGDCLDVLRTLPDACADAVVTDPPAGIGFLGQEWDSDKGGRDRWITWLASVMRECLRVLKPGGHALVWSLPRTSHWTATACEEAGFEVRERLAHLFGTGFPKSLSVSRAVDAHLGAGAVAGRGPAVDRTVLDVGGSTGRAENGLKAVWEPSAPRTPEAVRWAGFGTALKPAVEDWWLLRKPFDGTVAQNVLAHGTGALDIDGCRIRSGASPSVDRRQGKAPGESIAACGWRSAARPAEYSAPRPGEALGRFPANLVLSHAPGCVPAGLRRVKAAANAGSVSMSAGRLYGTYAGNRPAFDYADADGMEEVEAWECAPGCPVAPLDAQSGGAGRFFCTFAPDPDPFLYCAKASRSEREAGLEGFAPADPQGTVGREAGSAGALNPRAGAGGSSGSPSQVCAKCGLNVDGGRMVLPCREGGGHEAADGRLRPWRANTHPTVKPVALMRWLVRLVTPPGGLVLDPFAGSGSTGVACRHEGFRFLGIEREPEYVQIARARIGAVREQLRLPGTSDAA